jgi:hypothetical protein
MNVSLLGCSRCRTARIELIYAARSEIISVVGAAKKYTAEGKMNGSVFKPTQLRHTLTICCCVKYKLIYLV